MIGPTQAALLAKAGSGGVIIPRGNAECCAARRLAKRGLLTQYKLGGNGGRLTVYAIRGKL